MFILLFGFESRGKHQLLTDREHCLTEILMHDRGRLGLSRDNSLLGWLPAILCRLVHVIDLGV